MGKEQNDSVINLWRKKHKKGDENYQTDNDEHTHTYLYIHKHRDEQNTQYLIIFRCNWTVIIIVTIITLYVCQAGTYKKTESFLPNQSMHTHTHTLWHVQLCN